MDILITRDMCHRAELIDAVLNMQWLIKTFWTSLAVIIYNTVHIIPPINITETAEMTDIFQLFWWLVSFAAYASTSTCYVICD